MATLFSLFGEHKDIHPSLLHAPCNPVLNNHQLDLYFSFTTIVDEKLFPPVEKLFTKQFKSLEEITTHIKYQLQIDSTKDLLTAIFSNLLAYIARLNPSASAILQNSKKEFSAPIWTFFISDAALFLFQKMNIQMHIESYLKNRLDIDIVVQFSVVEIKTVLEKPRMILNAPLPMAETATSPVGDAKGKNYEPVTSSNRRSRLRSDLKGLSLPMDSAFIPNETLVVQGDIFDVEVKTLQNGKLLVIFDITDYVDSITGKIFMGTEEYSEYKDILQIGNCVKIKGVYQYDTFSKDYQVMVQQIARGILHRVARMDEAATKRVELHLHTNMSAEDAISSPSAYIEQAAKWGHTAIGITDHGVLQAYPEAMDAARKHQIKVLYGIEAYVVNDATPIARNSQNRPLDIDDTFVVIDLETTGLTRRDKIIEIGAIKIEKGQIIDEFHALINPQIKLSAKIIELTKIEDHMLQDKKTIDKVLPDFLAFIKDSVIVAHNAAFDCGFLDRIFLELGYDFNYPNLCTMELSRVLFPELARHRLDRVAKHLGISLESHHRAIDDAKATAEIFLILLDKLIFEEHITALGDINLLTKKRKLKHLPSFHCIIYAKNKKGLKNLYQLVSASHMEHFYRTPRMPKSSIIPMKEDFVIGSACSQGEIFNGVLLNKPHHDMREMLDFYDYLEIQPLSNNEYLVHNKTVETVDHLKSLNQQIIKLGALFKKPVVATTDCHFLSPADEIHRKIIMAKKGFSDVHRDNPLFFRTTEEMLDAFAYVGDEKARELVIDNTQKIASWIEDILPIPDGVFPPKLPHADEDLEKDTWEATKKLYGDPLPAIVKARIDKELSSIIGNGFSSLYTASQKLVQKSVADGYLVGSRGSVGSSLVATVTGITEVNPLSPHYLCEHCQYSDFDSPAVLNFAGRSGCDMPAKTCPNCGASLRKDGHDIAFETFLGFDGDKEPDIDLNFSGEYQNTAHKYAAELFGKEHIFKAGTIGTLADKTAINYTLEYLENLNLTKRKAEVKRLARGLTGVKRTTGQHPGGLVVVPAGRSIFEFSPIQYPANDPTKEIITTHFDFHSLEGRLFKLDILGHDVPTIIKDLYDATGVNPQKVDIGDEKVIKVFSSPTSIGLTEKDFPTGSLGLPEFGTNFVRSMLLETNPSSFSDLVRISGLSHGTQVWAGNGQNLVAGEIATLREIVSTRDQIMSDLIMAGVDNLKAFTIMEDVRRGREITATDVVMLREKGIKEWYIDSCQKIQYLFPKGHAVAYVMMAVRIAYFKIYHPEAFYMAVFSTKLSDFNYGLMCRGLAICEAETERIKSLGWEASHAERTSILTFELVAEMYKRNIDFSPLDIYRSHATKFILQDHQILPPLSAVPGLGENAALAMVEARKDGEFLSKEDIRKRTSISNTVLDQLSSFGLLGDMPETNQLTLF